jgi:hypothetical protein
MKKVRINTTLRRSLENYVRNQINDGIDQSPLEAARRQLEAEALRLVAQAYPEADMAILAQYGRADRYCRFTFRLPEGEASGFEFAQPLPYDLPECGGYRFEPTIDADAAFAAAAQAVAKAETALREEAKRQWKQAEVLVGCALYFEDVLDYLGIPDSERVNLSHRWRLPVTPAMPESGPEADEADEEGEDAPQTASEPELLETVESLGQAIEGQDAAAVAEIWFFHLKPELAKAKAA